MDFSTIEVTEEGSIRGGRRKEASGEEGGSQHQGRKEVASTGGLKLNFFYFFKSLRIFVVFNFELLVSPISKVRFLFQIL